MKLHKILIRAVINLARALVALPALADEQAGRPAATRAGDKKK